MSGSNFQCQTFHKSPFHYISCIFSIPFSKFLYLFMLPTQLCEEENRVKSCCRIEEIEIFRGNECQVNDISVTSFLDCKHRIISCSKDKTIRVFQENCEMVYTHTNSLWSVLCLEESNNVLLLTDDKGDLLIFESQPEIKLLKTINITKHEKQGSVKLWKLTKISENEFICCDGNPTSEFPHVFSINFPSLSSNENEEWYNDHDVKTIFPYEPGIRRNEGIECILRLSTDDVVLFGGQINKGESPIRRYELNHEKKPELYFSNILNNRCVFDLASLVISRSGCSDSEIILSTSKWNLNLWTAHRFQRNRGDLLKSIDFSPDMPRIILPFQDNISSVLISTKFGNIYRIDFTWLSEDPLVKYSIEQYSVLNPSEITCMRWYDSDHFVIGCKDGSIRLFSASEEIKFNFPIIGISNFEKLEFHPSSVQGLLYSEIFETKYLISYDDIGNIIFFNPSTKNIIECKVKHSKGFTELLFVKNNQQIFAISSDENGKLYSWIVIIKKKEERIIFKKHKSVKLGKNNSIFRKIVQKQQNDEEIMNNSNLLVSCCYEGRENIGDVKTITVSKKKLIVKTLFRRPKKLKKIKFFTKQQPNDVYFSLLNPEVLYCGSCKRNVISRYDFRDKMETKIVLDSSNHASNDENIYNICSIYSIFEGGGDEEILFVGTNHGSLYILKNETSITELNVFGDCKILSFSNYYLKKKIDRPRIIFIGTGDEYFRKDEIPHGKIFSLDYFENNQMKELYCEKIQGYKTFVGINSMVFFGNCNEDNLILYTCSRQQKEIKVWKVNHNFEVEKVGEVEEGEGEDDDQ